MCHCLCYHGYVSVSSCVPVPTAESCPQMSSDALSLLNSNFPQPCLWATGYILWSKVLEKKLKSPCKNPHHFLEQWFPNMVAHCYHLAGWSGGGGGAK